MKIFKTLLILTGLLLGAMPFTASAAAPEAPDVLVRRVTEEVMETARNDKGIKAGDRRRIVAVVEAKILPHLDFRRATALTVGRHWRQATPQQKQQLTEEFRALMIHTYAGAMSQISDQKLEYKPMRADPGDTDVEVRFQVRQTRTGDPVQVIYRMHKAPDGWKVYDVNVLGAWLTETYRTSFSEEIARSGIDGLIQTLSEKNKKLAAQPPEPGKAAKTS